MNLDQFGRTMRERLLANRHKDQVDVARGVGDEPALQDQGPGWRRESPEYMAGLVDQAVRDLRDAFMPPAKAEDLTPPADPALVLEKAGDVANLVYMCADLAAGDGDNAYLREHLTLAEQIGAALIALAPEIWVCEDCNRAEAFDDTGPWHACRHCGCLNFRRTDGTSERHQVRGPIGEAQPRGGCPVSGG